MLWEDWEAAAAVSRQQVALRTRPLSDAEREEGVSVIAHKAGTGWGCVTGRGARPRVIASLPPSLAENLSSVLTVAGTFQTLGWSRGQGGLKGVPPTAPAPFLVGVGWSVGVEQERKYNVGELGARRRMERTEAVTDDTFEQPGGGVGGWGRSAVSREGRSGGRSGPSCGSGDWSGSGSGRGRGRVGSVSRDRAGGAGSASAGVG